MSATASPAKAKAMPDLGNNLSDDDTAPPLAPLTPPGALPDVNAQIAALTAQIAALAAITGGVLQAVAGARPAAISDEVLQAQAATEAMPTTPVDEKRVRIVLEDNDQIPPGGQFVQVDGRPFMLQSGYEVDAPVSLLDVLDHAITSVPLKDGNDTVIGYRDRLRFPYRVVRHAGE